jgi:hypothetical protein
VAPDSREAPYLRGRALDKSGKRAAAIPFYEKAMGMTSDEEEKKEITEALQEAKAALPPALSPSPNHPPDGQPPADRP